MKVKSTEEYKKAKRSVRNFVIVDTIIGLVLFISLGIFGASIFTEAILILSYLYMLYVSSFDILIDAKERIRNKIKIESLQNENRLLRQERDYAIDETLILGNQLKKYEKLEKENETIDIL